MRTRATLLFAAVGILLLPFLVSRYHDTELRNSAPLAQVAFAGHNVGSGAWCECGSSTECACDDDETIQNHRTSPPNQKDKPDDPNEPNQDDTNPGPLALLVVLALLVWRFGR